MLKQFATLDLIVDFSIPTAWIISQDFSLYFDYLNSSPFTLKSLLGWVSNGCNFLDEHWYFVSYFHADRI